MKSLVASLACMIFAVVSTTARAQEEHASKAEAVTLVDAAVDHCKKVGLQQAFKDFTDKSNTAWRKKDLYVFVVNNEGVTVAHGGNEKLVGKSLVHMKDQNGKEFIQEMITVSKKGRGWVEYEWVNPQTNKQEAKASYVRPLPDFDGFVGVGIYR